MVPLTCWIRSTDREHGEKDPKDEEENRSPRNRYAVLVTGIKGSGYKLPLPPPDAAEDRRAPCEVVTGNRKTEKRLCGRGRDEAKKPKHGGEKGASPNGPEGDVAEFHGDGSEELGEREGAVTTECPGLARGGDQNRQAHQELNDEEEGHES